MVRNGVKMWVGSGLKGIENVGNGSRKVMGIAGGQTGKTGTTWDRKSRGKGSERTRDLQISGQEMENKEA